MTFPADGYVSHLLLGSLLSEYFFQDALKDIEPSITDEKLKSLESEGPKVMLKYCMDRNPARTYELVSLQTAQTLVEVMRRYIEPVGRKAANAESKEEFVKYANLFLELRKRNRLLIEEFAPDINFVLLPDGGSDVVYGDYPRKGTIPYAAEKFDEMLPPPDTEDRIIELLYEYRRKRSMAGCEARRAFMESLGSTVESGKDVEDDVNSAIKELEAAVRAYKQKAPL